MGELGAAWRTARLLASAKWRTVRTPGAQAWLWVGLLLGSGALSMSAQAGDLIRLVAEIDRADTTAGVVANTYIRQWAVAGFGTMTSAILAFALGTAVISPLLSSSAPTLMPDHQLVGVRTSSMHPYVSALAVHVSSLVTFVQLLALTALAGLVTIDGDGRGRAVLLSWLVWIALVFASQAFLWSSRVVRRRAPRATVAVVVAAAVAAAAGAGLAPDAAADLFGVSGGFVWWLLNAPAWAAVTTGLLAVAGSAAAGWAACAATVKANAVTAPAKGADRAARPMPARPTRALVAMVVRSFVRTRSIVAPLATITVLAAAGVTLAGDQPAAVWSVGIGVPLAVGLAWTDNAAAMTGAANPWLASLPGQAQRLLPVWAGWAWTVSVGLVTLAWLPSLLLGRVSWASTGSVLVTAAAAASTVTAAALWNAVRRPEPARTELGDGVLTASRAATASLRLLAVPGLAAWLATSGSIAVRAEGQAAPLAVQALGSVLCALAAGAVIAVMAYLWSNPRTRALCLAGAA